MLHAAGDDVVAGLEQTAQGQVEGLGDVGTEDHLEQIRRFEKPGNSLPPVPWGRQPLQAAANLGHFGYNGFIISNEPGGRILLTEIGSEFLTSGYSSSDYNKVIRDKPMLKENETQLGKELTIWIRISTYH
jgi:hypothetical protein